MEGGFWRRSGRREWSTEIERFGIYCLIFRICVIIWVALSDLG